MKIDSNQMQWSIKPLLSENGIHAFYIAIQKVYLEDLPNTLNILYIFSYFMKCMYCKLEIIINKYVQLLEKISKCHQRAPRA